MTDAPVVGSAAFELRATRQKLKEDLRQSEQDLKGFVDKAERDVGAGSKRIGGSIDGLVRGVTIGITAMVAVLAAGLAMVVRVGFASLKMADDIAGSAKRIGVGTAALQEWRYVAAKTGEDAQKVDGALESFAKKLAQASAGLSREAADAFAALGFKPEQLRSFKDTETALDAVIDRIGELSSASERAAIAERLGLGPLATALREGSDEVARLRDEAHDLGLVMDDALIQKGAAAQAQLDNLSKVIGIQMAEAFLSLSDEVLAFTGYIADALKGLNAFISGFREFVQRIDATYGEGTVKAALSGDTLTASSNVTRAVLSGRAGRVTQAYNTGPTDQDDPALLRQNMAVAASSAPRPRRGTPSGRTTLTPVDRSRSRADTSARETQRAAEREARRAERVQEEINRARVQALQIAQDDLLSVQQLYDLRRQELQARREGEDTELRSRLARKDLTQAEFDQLTSQLAINRRLEDRVASSLLGRDLEDERLANERLLANLTADLVSLQAGAARTAKDRLRLELELLEITQRQRRDALRQQLERNPNISAGERATALGRLDQIDLAERDAVGRRNMGPLDAWRDRSLQSAQEVREAYESIAARGLDTLNDGLVDAIMNTEDLGQTFSRIAKQIIADLAAIAVRRSIVEPLANMLFGGGAAGGGGGGGFMGTIGRFLGLSSAAPSLPTGDAGGLFSGRLLGNLASPLAGIMGSSAQAAPAVRLMVQSSPYFTAEVQSVAGPIAVEAGAQSFAAARQAIPAEMGRRANYRLR